MPKSEKGEYLFRKIIMQLDLIEEDYFGLQKFRPNGVEFSAGSGYLSRGKSLVLVVFDDMPDN